MTTIDDQPTDEAPNLVHGDEFVEALPSESGLFAPPIQLQRVFADPPGTYVDGENIYDSDDDYDDVLDSIDDIDDIIDGHINLTRIYELDNEAEVSDDEDSEVNCPLEKIIEEEDDYQDCIEKVAVAPDSLEATNQERNTDVIATSATNPTMPTNIATCTAIATPTPCLLQMYYWTIASLQLAMKEFSCPKCYAYI
jgi:hypothetical protein